MKLIVRWSKVERARGYEVRISLPRDGRRLLRTTAAKRRTLTIGGLERNDTGTVVVRAIDDQGNPGRARVASLRRPPRARAASSTRQRHIQRHLAVQNTWFTDANLRPYRVRNDVISISGHWFLQQGTHGGTFEDFLSASREDVERRLDRFKAAHPEVDPGTGATIVIDIERPHPKNLHTYSRPVRRAIVDAYRVRIAAAKAAFPNAKVALYGTLNPDALGRADDPTYDARRRSLVRAGRQGLYDHLDYLVPVLYVRFGCDDEVNGPCDRDWSTLDEYTQLGVDGSRRLRRRDGSRPPLLPLLGFRVYNRTSAFHRELLMNLGVPDPLEATLAAQIDILADNSVEHFALWTGRDSNELGGPNDPTVTDYLCVLFRSHCPRQ